MVVGVLTCRSNRFRYCKSEDVSIYSKIVSWYSGVAYRILDDQTRSLLLCVICFKIQHGVYKKSIPQKFLEILTGEI